MPPLCRIKRENVMNDNTIANSGMIAKVQGYKSINPVQPQIPTKSEAEKPQESKVQEVNSATTVNDTISVQSQITSRNLDTLRAIEQMHARLNQLVKGVRETNETINKVSMQVEKMNSSIQAIQKNFPPFAIDSQERQDILMEYVSLRKELMSLMVPPPPPPIYEKVQHMWESLFDQSGQVLTSEVPSLEPDSSDVQLQSTSAQLDKLSGKLADFSNSTTEALVNS